MPTPTHEGDLQAAALRLRVSLAASRFGNSSYALADLALAAQALLDAVDCLPPAPDSK